MPVRETFLSALNLIFTNIKVRKTLIARLLNEYRTIFLKCYLDIKIFVYYKIRS